MMFVTKFCFANGGPQNEGKLSYSAIGNLEGLSLVIYDDQPQSFPYFWNNRDRLSCSNNTASPPSKALVNLQANPACEPKKIKEKEK